MIPRIARVLTAVIVLSAAAANVHAATILYTDRALFEAAAFGLTEIDFNDQVTPPATFTDYGATTTISGVTFADTDLFAVTPAYFVGYGLGDSTVLSFQAASPNVLTITLPSGTTSVGMDFGAFNATMFSFVLSNGFTASLTGSDAPDATPTFAGFISDTAIASLTITATDPAPQIDRFDFGGATTAPPVPEPASLFLLGTGILGVAAKVRRRRQAE